ncbi:MAG: hypothetical protein Kow0092_11840 [Deferrisomatales bacterium]
METKRLVYHTAMRWPACFRHGIGVRSRVGWISVAAATGAPRWAWAVQAHGGEGLVAHQLGHGVLLLAMSTLALRAHRARRRPGWGRVRWGALWFCAWNAAALARHALPAQVAPLLDFDHLLLLPALACLWAGVARLGKGATGA